MARTNQVRMDLPNGLHVSIITDGYGSDQGLYEAMVWADTDQPQPPAELVTGQDGTEGPYGWLNEEALGLLIERAAKLTLQHAWV